MVLNIYTDGCCKSNGKQDSIGGYGIYFGENDERNVSKKLDGFVTNNIAELSSIIHAMFLVKDIKEKVNIYSDSNYSILCCTSYGKKCYNNFWNNPNDKTKPIPNLELVKKAYLLAKDLNHVSFKYIKAHTGLEDIHSKGNENADRLANESIGYFVKVKRKEKIYLNVSFKEKEEIKSLDGKWDYKKKKWYIYEDNIKKDEILGKFSFS